MHPAASPLHFGGATLHHGDNTDILPTLAAASVDAVVTDPPYMIGASSTGDPRQKSGSWMDLMNASHWYRSWMGECWRVLRPTGYLLIFANWRSLPMLLKACADSHIPATSLAVWNKDWIGPASPNQLRPVYELILFSAKPEARIDNRSQPDIFTHKWMAAHAGQSGHPAQKPVPLLRQLIELVTVPGDLVLDPFAGSATTGVAALQSGRRFLGIEGDPAWHRDAADRLRSAALPLHPMTAPQQLPLIA